MASVSGKIILSLVLVAQLIGQISSTLQLLPNKYDEKKVSQCREKFDTVQSTDTLSAFLDLVDISIGDKYMSEADIRKCLEMGGNASKKIGEFRTFFRESMYLGLYGTEIEGAICGEKYVKNLIDLHESLTNKLGLLSPWWERFVKQNIVDCKRDFIERLHSKEGEEQVTRVLTTLVNLAQNFNWNDPAHLVKDGPAIKTDMTGRNMVDLVGLVQTSGRIEEIRRLTDIKEVLPGKNDMLAKQEFELTKKQRANLDSITYFCGYFEKMKKHVLYPLLELQQLGYDDTALGLDQQIASYPHIHSWLASIQTCDLFEHIKIYNLGKNQSNDSIRLRLRPGKYFNPKAIDESRQNLLQGKFFEEPHDIGYGGRLLQVFDPNLDLIELNPRKWDERQRQTNDESRQINEAIFSGQVLTKLADFFTSSESEDE